MNRNQQRKYLSPFIFTVTVILIITAPHFSSAQKIFIKATLDSTSYRIGEWIPVHVSIAHPYKINFNWNQSDSLSINFQKLSETKTDTVSQKDFITENKTFTLTTFDTGALLIPSLCFYYIDEKNKKDSVFSNSLVIAVTSVTVDTTKAFKGIKPNLLVEVEKKKDNMLIYLLFGNTILICATGYFILKRRKRKTVTATGKKISSQTTLEKLKQLENENLQQQNIELYYVRLTEILREYIESNFNVAAFENTSAKIISYLHEKIKDPIILERLASDFHLADLVKFAKVNPSFDENKSAMNTAVEFVNKTTQTEKKNKDDAI